MAQITGSQPSIRLSQELPIYSQDGKLAELVGDCVVKIKNVKEGCVNLEIATKEEFFFDTLEYQDCIVEMPLEHKQTGIRARFNKEFSDGYTPRKLILNGLGTATIGASVLAGSRYVADSGNKESSDPLGNGMAIGGAGMVVGGGYMILRGLYRFATGNAMDSSVTEVVDDLAEKSKEAMSKRAINKFA